MNGGGSERGRHRIQNRLQAPSCQHRTRRGARTHGPRDRDLSRSWQLNRLSHPGAPIYPVLDRTPIPPHRHTSNYIIGFMWEIIPCKKVTRHIQLCDIPHFPLILSRKSSPVQRNKPRCHCEAGSAMSHRQQHQGHWSPHL